MRYTQEDTNFIQYINRKLNNATAITFTLPADSIYDEIVDASQYFYEWLPESTTRNWLGISLSDINAQREVNGNCILQLPEYIFSVNRVVLGSVYGNTVNDLFAIPFLQRGLFTFYQHDSMDVSNFAINMFEARTNESYNKKGLNYDFNNTNCQLSVLGKPTSDIVLEVERKIDIKYLYNHRLFKKYVLGKCLENLASILSTFSFELIGGTNINFDMIQSKGERDVEEVKQELENMNSNSMIFGF